MAARDGIEPPSTAYWKVVWNFLSTLFSTVGYHERFGTLLDLWKLLLQQQSSLAKYLF
jgi:hypothetical protein